MISVVIHFSGRMGSQEQLLGSTKAVGKAEVLGSIPYSKSSKKLPWYFANGFLLFWPLLFFAVVIPFVYRLPTALTKEDAVRDVFIAERAYKDLYVLSNIGNKRVGSKENEIEAIEFLLKELEQIKEDSLKELFEIDIDLSQSSGMFKTGGILRLYQGVQNIAVKLTPKSSSSENFLLVNSHFDTDPGAGAGDAGFMIVAMLETLRVMATTKQTFDHPIVFLFNGAEETGLLASHGFITQHKWAPFCKAVVNLDAAGSGGREILFQSGPNHPWLVDYYKKYIKYPFATTSAEEIFQAGIIPSDTDFRQFKTYGNIPGLDMAQCINGFVYHTKYDLIDIIPRESLENTGDNLLSLVRGLANATELFDTEAYKPGSVVFFDFLGFYFVKYSEATGRYLNFGFAAVSIILVCISMFRMDAVSHVSICHVLGWFILVLIVQIVSFVLGLVLPVVVAQVMDNLGLPLTYYSTPLLVIGLYVCPSLIGLSLPVVMYFALKRNEKMSDAFHQQLSLHGQAVILSLLALALTLSGMRSAYIFVIPLAFYVLSLAINLLTTLHDRGYAWSGLHKISQVVPFLYSSYLFYVFIVVLTPMGGRSGSVANWDMYIAVLASVGTVLSFGFLMPLISTFRRPSMVVLALVAISALAMYLASSTQIGFAYRPKTSGQRLECLQIRTIFYEYDGTLVSDESGYMFNFVDRLKEKPLLGSKVNYTGWSSLEPRCVAHMMCGMPFFRLGSYLGQMSNKWLPREEHIEIPQTTKLELERKTLLNTTTTRFEFNLTGPCHMRLFIQPYEDVTISNWSFLQSYLDKPVSKIDPYLIFVTLGIDDTPLNFFFDISKPNGDFNVPLLQLGLAAHYVGQKSDRLSEEFLASFPSFTMLDSWPALYQRFIF